MDKPIRIQRKRTKGFKMPENTVYVGRPTKYGNPFKIGEEYESDKGFQKIETAQQAVNLYDQSIHFYGSPVSVNEIKKELKGKNLACWCGNSPCHADVLLEIANETQTD